MVNRLTPAQMERLGNAVTAAERTTGAEIVLVVAAACDEYAVYPLLWATAIAFVFFGGLAFLWPLMHVRFAFLCTGLVCLFLAVALHWRPLRLWLVPAHAKHDHAVRSAAAHFATHVAGRTSAANGLLIFVALAERYVEIIPEAGISREIPAGAWTAVVTELLDEIGRGRLVDGLEAAIARCAQVLAPAFPHRPGDRNEIPDAVVFTPQ
jgi:putative membrane protein